MKNINLIKIGSDSISEKNISKLLKDIKKYEEITGEFFVIISSGAVKMGKNRIKEIGLNKNNFLLSSLFSVGQIYLIQMYDKLSGKNKLVGEILLDDYINKDYIAKITKKLLDTNNLSFLIKKLASKILRPC